jgi:hypothetical protein
MLPKVTRFILLETLAQNYGFHETTTVTTATSETTSLSGTKNLTIRQQRRFAVDDERLR